MHCLFSAFSLGLITPVSCDLPDDLASTNRGPEGPGRACGGLSKSASRPNP